MAYTPGYNTVTGPNFVGSELVSGVHVMSINTEVDHHSQHVRIVVELRAALDANDIVSSAMGQLEAAFRHRPASASVGSSDRITINGAPNDDEPDADAPDVMLRELRAHLDARLDEIDQALRLVVDP